MTQMKTEQQQIGDVVALFQKYSPEIEKVRPSHLSIERILNMANLAVKRNPKLAACTHRSLVECLLAATQVGLELDGIGQKAYLVPYKKKCTLIFGYKGLLELARNSRDVRTILPPQLACANDEFDYELGSKPWITHKPKLDDRGEPTHYYVVSISPCGERMFTVLSLRQVEGIKADVCARTGATDGVWFDFFDDMGLKSAIRRHCKYISSSPQLQAAIAMDEQAEIGKQAIAILDVALPQEEGGAAPAKKTLDDLVPKTEPRDPFKPEKVADGPVPGNDEGKTPASPKCSRCGETDGHMANCPNENTPADKPTTTTEPEPPIDESTPIWANPDGKEPVPPITAESDSVTGATVADRVRKLDRVRGLYLQVEPDLRQSVLEDFGTSTEEVAELDADTLQNLGTALSKALTEQVSG